MDRFVLLVRDGTSISVSRAPLRAMYPTCARAPRSTVATGPFPCTGGAYLDYTDYSKRFYTVPHKNVQNSDTQFSLTL